MKVVYEHCCCDHLHRDLAEFNFRLRRSALSYEDAERALAP
jgi:hypothetical protein